MNELINTNFATVSDNSNLTYTVTPDSLFGGLQGAFEIVIIVFGTIATIIIAFSYIPQLVTTYKTKGTTGLSFYMWLLIVIAEIGFTIWGILYLAQGCQATTAKELYNLGALQVKVSGGNATNDQIIAYLNAWAPTHQSVIAQAHHIAVSQGLINGLALFVCDLICGIVAALILSYKIKNMKEAKGISEADLCDQKYAAIQAKKAGK